MLSESAFDFLELAFAGFDLLTFEEKVALDALLEGAETFFFESDLVFLLEHGARGDAGAGVWVVVGHGQDAGKGLVGVVAGVEVCVVLAERFCSVVFVEDFMGEVLEVVKVGDEKGVFEGDEVGDVRVEDVNGSPGVLSDAFDLV